MKKVLFIILGLMSVVYSSTTDKIDVDITMKNTSRIFQNSVGLLEISVDVKNLNPKTIKYMWMEVGAYNKVDDLLSTNIGGNECKATGPVNYYQIHTSGGCTSYYDSIVSKVKVRITKVEYMDGTINENPTDYYTFVKETQNRIAGKTASDTFWKIYLGILGGGLILSLFIG
jgi:hypothetical protein